MANITSRLEKRSLIQPAKGAKITNGSAMSIAARNSASIFPPPGIAIPQASAPASGMRMNCAILSLNAFCVCCTIMLQNPTQLRTETDGCSERDMDG